MAHTYISTDNQRGNQVTAANPSYAHIRGWNAGVRVEAQGKGTRFEIYMTAGSEGGPDVHLGTVELTADGPEFTRSVESVTP